MNKKEIIEFVPIDGKLYISLENANKSIDIMQKRIEKQKEVIDKAIELRNNFAKENAGLIFENNEFIKFMNNLLDILKEGKNE